MSVRYSIQISLREFVEETKEENAMPSRFSCSRSSWKFPHHRAGLVLGLMVLVLAGRQANAQGAFNVLTRNYNNQRTGANTSETTLNNSNVNASQFGKLFMLPVDDQVYSGVLYVSSLEIGGATHNVIFVETTNNSVYAFDADTLGPPLWTRNFNNGGQPSNNTELGGACGTYTDFRGTIGIVSTPVIDSTTRTMFFVTRVVTNGNTVQQLHAIDITTGYDEANSPQVIQASVSGTGDGGSTDVFNTITQNQRTALSLSQGVIYIAWGSYCDTTPYHGWVMAYNETTLAQLGAFNSTENGSMGGIWMAGAGPVFDNSGNLYYATGNGDFNGAGNYGESLVKLAPSSLGLLDFFAPSEYNTLNASDLDFGSAGPVMLPGGNLVAQGGKTGIIYLMKTSNLGQEVSGDTQIPQFFQAVNTTIRPSATHHIHNASPIWTGPSGLNLYVWGENDYLRLYQFNSSSQTFNTPSAQTGSVLPPVGMPGGMMVVSANGSTAGTGLVWASVPRNGDANQFTTPGNLYAFDAGSLALLWSSTGTSQDLFNFSKGSAPVVANGKVYVGSISRFVSVFGLTTSAPAPQNLALNKTTTSSTVCSSGQSGAQAVDGSFSTAWCSSVANPWLTVDLGAPYNISRFVLEHAGAGGGAFDLNTAAYTIQVSTDGVNFTQVVNVTGNVDSITTDDIPATTARYVQLSIVTANQGVNSTALIYELQVFAVPTSASANFTLAATPASATGIAGSSSNFNVTAISTNGFNGTITLGATGLPAGASVSYNPPTLTGSGNTTATVTTACSTPPGTYTVALTGTSGSLTNSANVSITVNPVTNLCAAFSRIGLVNDGTTFSGGLDLTGNAYSANLLGSTVSFAGATFTLGPPNGPSAATSTTIALQAGQYSSLSLLGTAVNGGQNSQVFTVTYSDGTTANFTQSVSDWFMPQSYSGESKAVTMAYRDVSNGTKNNQTFYLYGYTFALNSSKTATNLTLPNNNDVVILGLSLTGTSSPSFSVSATPASQSVTAGSGTSYTATVTPSGGFTGTVTLSASGLPTGATATFNPTSVSGSGSSTITVSTTSSTASGSYPVTITGASGSLQPSTKVTLVVAGDATSGTAVNLTSAYNVSGIVTDGTTFSSTGGLDRGGYAYSSNLLGSTVTAGGVSFTLGPANAPDVVSNATVTLPAGQFTSLSLVGTAVNGNQQSQTFTVEYTDGTTSVFTQSLSDWSVWQNYTGETKAVVMSYRDMSSGTKQNQTFNLYQYTFTLNSAKTVSTITLPSNQNVVVLAMTLTGSGSPNFSISAAPSSQTVTAGSGTSYTATITALSGFNGSVALTAGGLPTGATASFSPASVSGSGTSTVTVTTSSSTAAGTYPITITGTSGSLQNSASVTLNIGGFSISATPASQYVPAGSGTSYTATVTASSGFTGSVALSAGGLPSGATASFNPTSVSGSGSSTVTISTTTATAAGSYPFTITGASGSLQQSASVTLNVGAFTFSAAPSSQSVTAGSGTSYTATIGSTGGFNGTVTLSASGLPTGATATFNPTAVSGAGTSTMTVSTSSSTAAGSYPVTITGASGSLQQSAQVTLTVASGGSSPSSVAVNLASAYNVSGIVTDGTTFSSTGGLDRGGYAYSSNLLGSTVTAGGVSFTLGPANAPDVVSNATVTLPAGQFTSLSLVGAGVNGNQQSQTFTVEYTDGTTSVFTQSLSDWSVWQDYTGETRAVIMSYRDMSSGAKQTKTLNLYQYTFTLNSAKTVSTITLPSNQNVVVLAMTLTGSGSPSFSTSATPTSQAVTAGSGTRYTATITALSGFNGSVTLSAGGLPTGATASFSPASVSGSGASTVTVTTSSSTAAGTYPITITGTSGSLQNSASVTLVVNGGSTPQAVNLASAYNVSGMVTDGTTFSASGGLDRGGNAYSANLLGSTVTVGSTSFTLGPANAPDVVANATITLPAGQFSTLSMLATAVDGSQTSETFTVEYTDGTTSVFTQSLSDWFSPTSYPGETKAVTMAYRDMSTGAKDNRTFYVYAYSFALNSSKTVSTVTLPGTANVLVLAMTLTP